MLAGSHLAARGKNRIYYVRLAVPLHLRGVVGARERIKSLGTSDHRAAERLALPFLDQWKSEFESFERLGTDEVDLRALAVKTAYVNLTPLLNEAWAKVSSDGYDDQLRKRQSELRAFTRAKLAGDFSHWEDVADRTLRKVAPRVLVDVSKRQQFLEFLSQAGIDAVQEDLYRRNGDQSAGPTSVIVRTELAKKHELPAQGRTLIDLYDQFSAQRLTEERKRPDTITQERKVVEGFSAFIGVNRAVSGIAKSDIRAWLTARKAVPASFSKMKAFAGINLRQAVDKASGLDLRQSAPKTINKDLSAISGLFRWLVTQDFHEGPNPCDGLFLDVKKGGNPRPPLTTEQLNIILKSPLFTGFVRDGREHVPGPQVANDWRYWIPLVCLFTGARVSEIAQLRLEDVTDDSDGALIYIRHDVEAGLSTKSGKTRVAPVHHKLAQLGFMAFHAARKQAVASALGSQLFPEMKADRRGNFGAKASRFWRHYLRDIEIKTDRAGGDGIGMHSFRHTLADRLRDEAGLLDMPIAVALGHSLMTTTGGYGRVGQGTANVLRKMFAELRFDGVEFDHLVPAA